MNEHNEIEERLLLHDIKPTATRLLVFKALLEAEDAMSLSDLEDTLIRSFDKNGRAMQDPPERNSYFSSYKR